MLESLFNKVADLQVSRPGILLKRDSNTVSFRWILRNLRFEVTPILRNICEWLLLYESELFMFLHYDVIFYCLLYWKSILFVTQRNFFLNFLFFFLILLVNNKQNILTLVKLNPLCDKKTTHVKKSFDLFLMDSF